MKTVVSHAVLRVVPDLAAKHSALQLLVLLLPSQEPAVLDSGIELAMHFVETTRKHHAGPNYEGRCLAERLNFAVPLVLAAE